MTLNLYILTYASILIFSNEIKKINTYMNGFNHPGSWLFYGKYIPDPFPNKGYMCTFTGIYNLFLFFLFLILMTLTRTNISVLLARSG